MRLALALGRRHLGRTWPNPSVGAVLVTTVGDRPQLIAQGITAPGGRPHAERIALERAGSAARGATLYVSLEPCSHEGRTPPCAAAVAEAGIARVVSALEDPDPRVSGQGHALLRAAGVEVAIGMLAEEAGRAHRGHVMRITQGRPAVTLKLAQTPDGYAARRLGPRLLVTGDAVQARVHLMRARADAILVGVGTILADDPLLTVRLPGLEACSPVRVVLDSRLSTPTRSRVVEGAGTVPTWIVAGPEAPAEAELRLTGRGVEVLRVGADPSGRIRLDEALRRLAERGLTRLFCEGGPSLGEALAAADALDEVVIATGATPLGELGRPALGPALRAALRERLRATEDEEVGPDRLHLFERRA
jgi:diaminohydroxyphosphoribosylaminopyrimidine deaminase/5-amino-6-(5-phosphoribosylamino)uracil reductase